jgi:UDP-3-O-[3-hydroxymyristoyl] glucosamine N-acyltransferase
MSNNYTALPGVTNYVDKSAKIGNNVKVWHFAYVGKDAEIGDNVMIGSLTHVDYKVRIGDNTRIEGSVYIPPLTVIGKNVFIGPAAAFTNDPYPMSPKMAGVIVEDGAIIGGRSVFKPGIRVGRNSVVAMAVLPDTVVMGHPARPAYSRAEYDRKKKEWESKK